MSKIILEKKHKKQIIIFAIFQGALVGFLVGGLDFYGTGVRFDFKEGLLFASILFVTIIITQYFIVRYQIKKGKDNA